MFFSILLSGLREGLHWPRRAVRW